MKLLANKVAAGINPPPLFFGCGDLQRHVHSWQLLRACAPCTLEEEDNREETMSLLFASSSLAYANTVLPQTHTHRHTHTHTHTQTHTLPEVLRACRVHAPAHVYASTKRVQSVYSLCLT
jgi:hypothetical protein